MFFCVSGFEKVVGGAYYFQNLAEFSKEIPLKTPMLKKNRALRAKKWWVGFIIFQKSLKNTVGDLSWGVLLLTPRYQYSH